MIVSQATLRAEDLIPAYLDALEELTEHDETSERAGDALARFRANAETLAGFPGFTEEEMRDEDSSFYGTEEVYWVLEELFDALNDAAPEGTYFSAHPGDGALFGFWPVPCDKHDWSEYPLDDCPACQENVKRVENWGKN